MIPFGTKCDGTHRQGPNRCSYHTFLAKHRLRSKGVSHVAHKLHHQEDEWGASGEHHCSDATNTSDGNGGASSHVRLPKPGRRGSS